MVIAFLNQFNLRYSKYYPQDVNQFFRFDVNVINSDSYCEWVIIMENTNLRLTSIDN